MQNSSVTSVVIANNSIITEKIADEAVTTSKIANNSITNDKIPDNSISTAKLQNSSATSSIIADNSVTTNKLANSAITTDKILNNAVTESKIASNAVTTDKLANNSVSTNAITNGSVTPDKLSTGGPSWGGGTFSTNTQTGLELGPNITADTDSFIDFHSAPGGDYDARVWRRPGVNGNLDIYNGGTGAIWLNQIGSGSINFATNNASRVTIDQNGATTLNGVVNANDTIYANNYVWLSDDPTNNRHATTKQYVDSRIPNYSFTFGSNETYTYQNTIGKWSEAKNYFDVFPPSGKNINDLIAFIPSVLYIAFAGGVNYDDATSCYWRRVNSSGGTTSVDRIRVWVGNTEMRANPKANWLAVWN